MRAEFDPIYLSELCASHMSRLDQLTVVRNAVRKLFLAHDISAEGDYVDECSIDVSWLDGDTETLVFDRMVGFPLEPDRDWYAEWKKEVLNE